MHRELWKGLLFGAVCLAAVGSASGEPPRPAPPVALTALPRFRGFNLTEKFTVGSEKPFREEDFRLITELGFNFVRLPLDYRCFAALDHRNLNERSLREIDEAVAFGKKYGVHVCLNFHRAPGYCVNPPPEPKSLWTDAAAREQFARLWGAFAARYRGFSSRDVSFNLVNEPGDLEAAVYSSVMMKAVRAIRTEDPHRLIVVDGLRWGQVPVDGITGDWIIQAARGYAPMEITHFKASWVTGSDRLPTPVWPMYRGIPGFLYGPFKRDLQTPLEISVGVEKETRLSVTVRQVSSLSRLIVKADGKTVFDKAFKPGPGNGEWSEVVFAKEWNIYQNIYDRSYSMVIPAGTTSVTLENTEGDWLTLTEIRLEPYNETLKEPVILRVNATAWGEKQKAVRLSPAGRLERGRDDILYDARWFKDVSLAPWLAFEKRGGAVMVGEFGVYNRTPHAVTLAFLEDFLKTVKEAGWGWALWNFRGGFGVLDSERADAVYEDFCGHKLDRQMLEILKKY